MINTNTIIIGASAAGLACAACLSRAGISYILLEQEAYVAHSWRNHYDRLHLNTRKKHSSLPYMPFPDDAPVYVSKAEVVEYLEAYVKKFAIAPLFNQRVTAIRKADVNWVAETDHNSFSAPNLVVATGFNRKPFIPAWEGLENYQGTILHSSAYKNGRDFSGKRVLVVGFGNSACEISICLHEYGAYPSLSVQSAVNIVSRGNGESKLESLFDSFAWVSKFAPRLIDSVNASALHAKFGTMKDYGLQKLPYGPNVQIVKYNRVPLLDIGTFDLIQNGIIKVYPGIKRFTEETICFADGREESFDAVILGTGYRTGLSDFLPDNLGLVDREGRPVGKGVASFQAGLYFCGFKTSPLGMLREIGREAKVISRLLSKNART